MKLTRKEFFQTLLTSGLALLAGQTTACRNPSNTTADKNPYEYSIDQFKHIDAKLITHQELEPITLGHWIPKKIAITPNDELIVAGDHRIVLLNHHFVTRASFELDDTIYAIAALSSNEILVAFKDHLVEYNEKGRIQKPWSSLGDEAFITGVDVNSTHVVIADYGHKQLWLFKRSGALQKMIAFRAHHHHGSGGFKIPSPYFDAHFGADGSIWSTHPGMHRIENYDLNGQLISGWGRFGMDIEGFSGCCNPTHFAILPHQELITVEKGLVRIKHYTRDGQLLGVVAAPSSFQEGLTGVDLAVGSKGRIFIVDQFQKQIRVFTP